MYYTLNITDTDKLFFTSDTHFGHYGICRYCKRPFESRSHMDKTLIDNWNKVVPEDGIVVHCGDFMLPHDENVKEYRKILTKLNGRILLCRGNHDRIPLNINEDGKLIAVVDTAVVKIGSELITAYHCPLHCYPTDYQVFGHIHTLADGKCYGTDSYVNDNLQPNQYDVGVDQNGYRPISYKELKKIFEDRMKGE